MEFSKYIVPIYVGDDYRGNGFIVNKMLIMPYHLLKIEPRSWDIHSSFCFKYDGISYLVEAIKSIVNQGGEKDVTDNPSLARDLLVFNTEINSSNLTLSPEYILGQDCWYYGYNIEGHLLLKEIIAMGKIHQQKAVVVVNGQPVELDNGMTCICKLKPGNSGGLVCQGNNIIGMFIKDQSFLGGAYQSIFIKANYILGTISKKIGFTFE